MAASKKNVAYFYDPDVGNFHYGPGHPMKPHRIRMTHNLVMSYELYKKMSIYRAAPATCQEMTQFHSDDYVDFLHRVTPENASQFQREMGKYNFEDDCPVFDGMFDMFSLSAGSSMEGAARLNRGLSDICINWSGGLHHAKKCEASGFCYINDIVLAILELLRHHQRVLYIDIDVHHGDGVEEAFYTTDRVMTCSFHKYGEFFPGTGDLRDIGEAKGKYYSVNFPLRDGIDDLSYESIFKPVIQHIIEWYQPNAVVLQCGTDSLAGDKIGSFNLSMDGHAECVRFVKGFNLPTLILGGGGYTIRNVSRVWAYETGILVGCEMDRRLPMNDYMDYYAPEYTLDVPAYNAENSNSPEYLERIKTQVLQNLDRTRFAPSVQMQDVPRDADDDLADEDVLDPEERMPETARDQHVVPDAEMYEADSMGLNESAKDGTKVVNEEINDMADKSVTDEDTVMKVDNEGDSSKSVNATASRFNDGGEAMDVDDEGDVGPSSSDNVTGAASSLPVVEPPLRETAAGVEAPIENPSEPVAIHADGDQSSSNNERAQASSASPPLAASTAAESKNETANPTISDDSAKDSKSAAAIGSKTETGSNKEKIPSNESSSPSKQPPSTENDAAAESTTHASEPTSKNNSTSTKTSETKSREEDEHQSVAIQASKHERKDTVEESARTNNSPEQSKSDNTSVTGSAAEKDTPQSSAAASEPGLAAKSVPVAAIAVGGSAPFVKAIQDIQTREKEEGEATEDDSENGDEDEDGEIRDT